ncbi:MAG: 4Fe-4S dicluster domain-containing protein, partial [Promethearchaeota archaeon]
MMDVVEVKMKAEQERVTFENDPNVSNKDRKLSIELITKIKGQNGIYKLRSYLGHGYLLNKYNYFNEEKTILGQVISYYKVKGYSRTKRNSRFRKLRNLVQKTLDKVSNEDKEEETDKDIEKDLKYKLKIIDVILSNSLDNYTIEETEPTAESIFALYPELFRCVACNNCTKACPMEVEVMDYISALKQGDIAKAARLSFDCIQCGL